MSLNIARISFYGREALYDFHGTDGETESLLNAAKRLSAGRQDVNHYYRLDVSDQLAAVISIAEIQTMQFMQKPSAGGLDVTRFLDQGIALFIKGREAPVILNADATGPLDDMLTGLLESEYGESGIGCVMLSDHEGNPIFLRLDEVQFALVSSDMLS